MSQSVLQDWVMELGLRHQGVLLTAVRGCDTAPKDDASKTLVRSLRNEFLNCFCGDPKKARTFIESVEEDELHERMIAFLKNCDHYPQHYVSHLMHAVEIVGYKKPCGHWLWFYTNLCRGLHVTPETEEELDERLGDEEESFGKRAEIK
jgi:hypothetical protein